MIGVSATIVTLILRLVSCHVKAKTNAYHEAYVAEAHEQQQPRTMTFAGLSLRLPGAPGLVNSDAYGHGSVVGGQPFDYSILWDEGSVASAASRDDIIAAIGKSRVATPVPSRSVEIGDLRAYEYELRWTNPVTFQPGLIITLLDCDGRYFTFAVDLRNRAENDNLVHSARCVPDKTAHSTTASFPVAVDAAVGWKRIDSPDELELVGPGALHLHAKLFARTDGSVDDTIEHAAGRVRLRLPATTRGDKVFLTGWLPDEGGSGTGREVAILGFRCEWGDVATVTIIGKPPLDAGILLADSGRCLGHGDPMPQYDH